MIRIRPNTTVVNHIWKQTQRQKNVLKGSARLLSTAPTLKDFQEQGILDENGLTVFKTLHEMQTVSSRVYAQNELFGTYNPKVSDFEYMTYKEFGDNVDRCRSMLKNLGVKEHDKVGIISNNRWEWAALATATFSLNASFVPMYEAQLPSDWKFILNDSGCSAVFCATKDIYDRLNIEVLPSTPSVHSAVCLDAPLGEPHAFATLMAQAEQDSKGSLIIPPTEEDLANLIYTSGTTGKPKGVELTHKNFVSNVYSAGRTMMDHPTDLVQQTDRSLAFLPWAHSYGQTVELWMHMSMGASMGVCRGIPSILEDMQLVRPTTLFAVPTLYKRIYDGVQNAMENASPLRKRLMESAFAIGNEHAASAQGLRPPLGFGERLKFAALDKLVLSKIRDRFGGRLRYGCVAGAACPPEVIRLMDACGITVCEGYGLTETSPMIAVNVPGYRVIGTVGRPITGVQVYIIGEDGKPVPPGEEGEICCAGPNVMRGYYKNQEATNEVITLAPDGKSRMFHTGDKGCLDKKGWLKVTGRIKEQYKLENGKYVVPTPIEEAIGMSRFITQVVVYGENRPHNIALIVPDWAAVRAELDFDDSVSENDIASDQKFKDLINAEIHDTCYKIKKFEVPKAWNVVAPFTVANNMLTQKLSVRRFNVVKAYEDEIAAMYGDDENVHEPIEKAA